MTFRRVALAVAALSLAGFLRTAYFHFVSEPARERPIPGPPIDDQFRLLRTLVPQAGEIGYVTDEPILTTPGFEFQGAKQRFLQMQYALAPAILRYDEDRTPYVIANVAEPAHLADVLNAHALRPIVQTGPATAVARPR